MYSKLFVAVLGALILGVQSALDDGTITRFEWVGIGLALIGAFIVWLTTNSVTGAFWRYAKAIAYGATAFGGNLLLLWSDGNISVNDWITLLIAALTGAGVLAVNGPKYNLPNPQRV